MSDPFSGLLTPPTYAHAHHTHTHSYGGDDDANDGGGFMDMLSARAQAEHQHTHGHSREASALPFPEHFPSGGGSGAHLSAYQYGLQPDPNAQGEVRGTAGAAQGSVGRFVVVEGSPMHRGEEETERNAPSPFPTHDGQIDGGDGGDGHGDDDDEAAQEDEDDQAERLRQERRQAQEQQQRHQQWQPQHQRNDSYPREFYVPRFPSMQVNGASVELRLSISALPMHSVTISPSAQGLEFSPPKLKWTPDSGTLERIFTAVPLATAREGRCKVSYIVGGDDATDYSEPGPSVLQMYSEDTALPLPSPPAEYTPSSLNSSRSNVFSPHSDMGSDGGMGPASARSSGGGMQMQQQQQSKNDRASFLAHGQPRQSGRFMVTDEVIDEELQGSPSNGASASPSSSPPALGSDNPLDLLSRLHASMAALMADNERLQQENTRLMQENAELRQRDSSYVIAPEDGRFNRYTPSPSPQPPVPQQQHRTAHISTQPVNVSVPPPKQRYGSGGGVGMGGGVGGGVFPQSNSMLNRPPSSMQHTSPPSGASGFMAGKQPIVMSNDKRATLPANFHAQRNNAAGALQHRGSMPPQQQQQLYQSQTAAPSPMSSPPSARRSSTPRELQAQQQQQQLHVQVSPPRLDAGVHQAAGARAKPTASATASPSGQVGRKNSIDYQNH